ncbi:MAG: Maf family protein [Gemmatimonadota bacterium]
MIPRLVLASASARRREILSRLGLCFELRPPSVDERWDPRETPGEAAVRIAAEKAIAVSREPDEIVLAADTLVAVDGQLLGKPANREEAVEMLMRLAGRAHSVFTGLALAHGDRVEAAVEETRVWFRPLARSECAEYVATGESLDKAGAYAIQGYGSSLVRRIDGDYFNVMGLPVHLLLGLLGLYRLRYAFGQLEEV